MTELKKDQIRGIPCNPHPKYFSIDATEEEAKESELTLDMLIDLMRKRGREALKGGQE
jgi:hypothetical protein